MNAVGLERVGGHLPHRIHVLAGCIQNEHAAKVGSDRGPQRIEGLRKIQAAGGGLRRSQHGHIGVSGHLQGGDAGGKNH